MKFGQSHSFAILLLAVVVVAVMPDVEGRFKLKAMGEDNYPTTYARESKPYSNLMFDKELPYVPRYRYPVRSYMGKRNKPGVNFDSRARRDYLIRVQKKSFDYDDYMDA